MIVKFHARGSGGGSGPVDYLLGKDREREHAKTLRGDPQQTVDLIDSSRYAKKYTSGVLSFEESDLTQHQKDKIMDSFQQALLPDMKSEQYDILWVEHRDKGRLELNFVIPNLDLESGKRLQPYYHAADCRRVDAWATVTRAEEQLADPNDPSRRQTLTPVKDLPKNKQEAVQAINYGLLALAGQGSIKSRDDVVRALTGAGMTVARETKSSISIADPDGGKNIRLKGALYERDLQLGERLRSEITRASSEYQASREERLQRARKDLDKGIEIKRGELQKRHPSQSKELEKYSAKQLEMDADNAVFIGREHDRSASSHQLDAEQQHHRNTTPARDVSEAEHAGHRVNRADRPKDKEEILLRGFTQGLEVSPSVRARENNLYPSGEVTNEQRDRDGIIERIRAVAERAHAASIELADRIRGTAEKLLRDLKEMDAADRKLERTERETERTNRSLEQGISEFTETLETVDGQQLRQQAAAVHIEQIREQGRQIQQTQKSRGYDNDRGHSRGGGGMEM